MSVTESSIVGPKGRVVVPQRFREELGIDEGDEVLFTVGPHGALCLLTRSQLVTALAGSWARANDSEQPVSLVDELFADRRAEAARDRS